MDHGEDTGSTRAADGDDHVTTGDDGWVDLSSMGLSDAFVSSIADDAEVAFPLFDGRVLKGPFYEMGDRGPLVEVWEVEISKTGAGMRGKAGAFVGHLDHDAGVSALLDEFGVGVWVCRVRGPNAVFKAEKWIKVGTVRQRLAVSKRRQRTDDDDEPTGTATERALLDELRVMREERERDRETREEQMTQLRDEMRQRDRDELDRLRRSIEQRQHDGPGPQGPLDVSSLLDQVEARMTEAERLREVFGRAPGEAPSTDERDLISAVMSDLGTVMEQAEKAGNLMKMFNGDGE